MEKRKWKRRVEKVRWRRQIHRTRRRIEAKM
jgi:hypothetical protein